MLHVTVEVVFDIEVFLNFCKLWITIVVVEKESFDAESISLATTFLPLCFLFGTFASLILVRRTVFHRKFLDKFFACINLC